MSFVSQTDPDIAGLIDAEVERQRHGLEFIASENYASLAVIQAMGTPLTNKYSEGYSSKRYYGGNEFIDRIELLAIERAKRIFGAEHANVQPHSGSQANQAAFFALAKPGETFLAMDLAHGGHLTHGSPVNFSGGIYRFVHYGVDRKTGRIDMNQVSDLARKHKPRVVVAGFSAYPRHPDFSAFRDIAESIGAYLVVDMAHFAGLVAARLHPDPVPYADVVTTTTHKTLRGPRGAMILCRMRDRLDPEGKKNLAQKIDAAVFPGIQGGPLDHVIAAKAVSFLEALQPDFSAYQAQALKNAQAMAATLLDEGLDLVSGGTDNHLLIIDLSSLGISGKEAEKWLDDVGVYANKNMIPFDSRTPFDPSGLRLGTPAVTTRGMRETECRVIASLIARILKSKNDPSEAGIVRERIRDMADAHPIYANWPNLST